MRIHSAQELEVCEQVGKGGFGVVYRGLVKATNEEVAIKQIDLESNDADLMEINREIQIISECRLPQITRFRGCFVKNYKLWVIMEYVNGGSLYEILQAGPVTNEVTILYIAQQILLALEYLHNQGKIHRDLKSQNILLSSKGEVKLTDFGVSAQLSSNFSRRNTTVGTPYWMAPEVILNDNGGHNNKADIWSLGCCMYELFLGKPPLQKAYPPMKALRYISKCQKDQHFHDIIQLEQLPISPEFKDFLKLCFIVDPRLRFSAKALLKHGFITKNKPDDKTRIKQIKSLITNKHLWDQDNHVPSPQNIYLPTEMVHNQKIWNQDKKDVEPVKFDISTIYHSPESTSPVEARDLSISPSPTKGSTTIPLPSAHDTKLKTVAKSVKPDLNKVLNKAFQKLESKHTLTTAQYDLLVALNANIIELASVNNNKILICQYLKYVIKELNKTDTLGKMILPSEFKGDTVKTKTAGEFDDIEDSLFETWVGEMKSMNLAS